MLFPACQRLDVAVIARVPFDEGSLTGTLRAGFLAGPRATGATCTSRRTHLKATLAHVDALAPLVPPDSSLPDLALRFILHHPAVSTIIPGMRRAHHVDANLAASGRPPLDAPLVEALAAHRWERDWQVP